MPRFRVADLSSGRLRLFQVREGTRLVTGTRLVGNVRMRKEILAAAIGLAVYVIGMASVLAFVR